MKKKPSAPRKPRARSAQLPAALLAAALRAQSEGVFIADCRLGPQGLKILFVNDSFCTMTGRPAKDLVGQTHGPLHLEKADLERLKRWLQKSKPTQPLVGEGYLVHPSGKTVYASWNFDPLCGPRGGITHIVATYTDRTEKRRMQETLVHSQRLDAVGRLAGGIAHDFNNLISVVNGYCQILASKLSDRPQALREVEEIHKAGQKAATLTRQLLAFGRRQSMDLRVINLNHVVRENTTILQRLLGDAGELALELDSELGNVRADPAQFQQVLLNLVINARDALRDKGRITISTSNRIVRAGLNRRATDTPPGHYVVLTVADNGTGMDAHTQEHLFEPFFTTKEEGKGTGLGLALVYGVIQQSNGFISVHSALLVGSTFEILLPTVSEPAEKIASTPFPTLPATRGHEGVLLVEDDAVVSKMVAGILTSDGYRVITVGQADEGLKTLADQNQTVQLLIGPMGPAGSDSEKLARSLNKAHAGLRVLHTGGQKNHRPKWLAANHQMHLPKPFALSELFKAARQLLDD